MRMRHTWWKERIYQAALLRHCPKHGGHQNTIPAGRDPQEAGTEDKGHYSGKKF